MIHLQIPAFPAETGTWGGLSSVIAIAEAAQLVGRQVTFSTSGNLSSILQQRGLRVSPVPPANLALLQM